LMYVGLVPRTSTGSRINVLYLRNYRVENLDRTRTSMVYWTLVISDDR